MMRALRVVGILLGTLAVVYEAGINLYLATPAFRRAVSFDPAQLLIEYDRAYSIIPGRVHVEGLRIRGRDPSIEWILTLSRCDFAFYPSDLLRQRFHATRVRGEGLSLRLRRRLSSPTPREVAALPPVPGFADPPIKGPPEPPLTDANYHLWSVDLEDVTAAHVREVWIDGLRLSGDFDVRGRWFFRPLRWLDIGPALLEVRALDVGSGTTALLGSDLQGQIETTIHPFDLRELDHGSFFPHVSVEARLEGVAHSKDIAELASFRLPLHIAAEDAQFALRLAANRGVLEAGSACDVAPARVTVSGDMAGGPLSVGATLHASAHVDDSTEARLLVHADGVQLRGRPAEVIAVSHVLATVSSRSLDLRQPFGDAAYDLAVDDMRTEAPDEWLARTGTLPPQVHVSRAEVVASGHVEGRMAGIERGEGLASASVRVERVTVRRGAVVVSGDAALKGRVERRCSAGPCEVTGDVHLEVSRAELESLESLRTVVELPASILLQRGRAKARGRVDWDLGAGSASGAGDVEIAGLRMKAGEETLEGWVRGVVRARATGSGIDLSGSALRFRSSAASGWWADLDVPRAQVRLRPALAIDTVVSIRAKDGSPVESVVAAQAGIPGWVAGWVPVDPLRASARILSRRHAFEVRGLRATGGGTTIDLSYVDRSPAAAWALLLQRGVLRVGVRGGAGGTSFSLMDADRWYAEQAFALRRAGDMAP